MTQLEQTGLNQNEFIPAWDELINPLDEIGLAHLAAEGDYRAFAVLYTKYEEPVFDFCLKATGSIEAAADATQSAFLETINCLKSKGNPELEFSLYLFAAASDASRQVAA